MDCDSWQFKYKECTVTGIGRAVDITLKNQRSKTTCVKDENYGVLSGTEIWVDNGCRGAFIVSLLDDTATTTVMPTVPEEEETEAPPEEETTAQSEEGTTTVPDMCFNWFGNNLNWETIP